VPPRLNLEAGRDRRLARRGPGEQTLGQLKRKKYFAGANRNGGGTQGFVGDRVPRARLRGEAGGERRGGFEEGGSENASGVTGLWEVMRSGRAVKKPFFGGEEDKPTEPVMSEGV